MQCDKCKTEMTEQEIFTYNVVKSAHDSFPESFSLPPKHCYECQGLSPILKAIRAMLPDEVKKEKINESNQISH
jgi:hypothetical protein